GERGFKERIRDVTPQLVEIERIDRKSLLRGGEQTEDSLGVERRIRGQDDSRRAGLGLRPGGPRGGRWRRRQRFHRRLPRGHRIRSSRTAVGLEDLSYDGS